MKEYGRKPYIAKSYHEMMFKTPNAHIWTKIVESHSEYEKPYSSDSYDGMQYLQPVMPGLFDFDWDWDFGGYDFEFDPYDPSTYPWSDEITFRCFTYPCYCAEERRCLVLPCTYPIVAVNLRSGCEGMKAEFFEGNIVCITAPASPPFGCRMDITLAVPYPNDQGVPAGITGKIPRILIAECGDCVTCVPDATMAYDEVTSGDTIVREDTAIVAITGLNTPFTWSVAGTGFTLDNATTTGTSNTLNASASACGTATITVTGCDAVAVTGYVRCTTGEWTFLGVQCDDPGTFTSQVSNTVERIHGKYKTITGLSLGSPHLVSEDCDDKCGGCGVCVWGYDCNAVNVNLDGDAFGDGCCCLLDGGTHFYCVTGSPNSYEWTCSP